MLLLFTHQNHTATLRSGNLALQVPFTAARQYLSAKVHILFVIETMLKKKVFCIRIFKGSLAVIYYK